MTSHTGIHALCLLVTVLSILEAGCTTDPAAQVDMNIGSSVRHTIALQTASPGAYGTGMDAAKAIDSYRGYQQDVAIKPQGSEKATESSIVLRNETITQDNQ